MMSVSELIDAYNDYFICLTAYYREGIIDLSNVKFFYPTTLLPLIIFIEKERCKYIEPTDPNVSKYLNTVMKKRGILDKNYRSYIPPICLPPSEKEFNEAMDKILSNIVENTMPNYLGKPPSKIKDILLYVISELVSNTYQHSQCTSAYIMAQRYENRGFVELSIIDNGITIAGSLGRKINLESDSEAIVRALEGCSSKEEKGRGYGLSTSVRNLTESLTGETLIASGRGLVYLHHTKKAFICNQKGKLEGTLISTRIPLQINDTNLSLSYEEHIDLSAYKIHISNET